MARQQLFRFNSYTTTTCNTRTAFSIHMAAGPFQHTPRGCCTHSISNEALPCRVGFEAFSILRFHNLSLISNFNPIVHYDFRSLQKKRCIKTKKKSTSSIQTPYSFLVCKRYVFRSDSIDIEEKRDFNCFIGKWKKSFLPLWTMGQIHVFTLDLKTGHLGYSNS